MTYLTLLLLPFMLHVCLHLAHINNTSCIVIFLCPFSCGAVYRCGHTSSDQPLVGGQDSAAGAAHRQQAGRKAPLPQHSPLPHDHG